MTNLEKKLLNRVKELEDKEVMNDQFMNGCLPLIVVFIIILCVLIFG